MRNATPLSSWLIPINAVLALAVAFLSVQVWRLSAHGLPREPLQALEIVQHQILDEHVAPQHEDDLMWRAVEGMVRSLDGYSEFIRPERVQGFEEDTSGQYAGIGIVMAEGVQPVTVRFPFAGGPAERAGILVGDRIIAVDGVPLAADSAEELHRKARQSMLGPTGTRVTLTVERQGRPPLSLAVERGAVQRPSVKWVRLLDAELGIGYVYVKAFQDRTRSELDQALAALEADLPGGLRGLVLDLRFDQGGLLDEAIALTNRFVREGTIVSLKKRDDALVQVHAADPALCTHPELPLVLLVNGASASASEVCAGALQDHGRAVVVGTRTFGKGVVQSIYRWKDLAFRLKLTTSHYYTPKGRSIEGTHRRSGDGSAAGGLEPDRVVKMSKQDAEALKSVLHDEEEPPGRLRARVAELEQALGLLQVAPPGPEQDLQLAAALDEVRRLAQAWRPVK